VNDRLKEIRKAEAESHIKAYSEYSLFQAGSWLAKPVKTVLELLPLFEEYESFRALDLGSGVGRNCIPVAMRFQEIPCTVDCVDILDMAIEKLRENACCYGVEEKIRGIVSSIDDYEIGKGAYDLIMAVSALEHIASPEAFTQKLIEIRGGLRPGGIVCLIINSGVTERDQATGELLPPQFEVNLETPELLWLLEETFQGWEKLKQTVVRQSYDIPREKGISRVETDVVTWVVRVCAH